MTIITVLVTGKDHYQPTEFVFKTTISETGWPVGISWILGLLQSAFSLTAFDSVMHLAEEVPRPEWNCPIAMVSAIGIGTVSGFIYLICLLYSVSDYDALLTSRNGALLESYYQATESRIGAVSLERLVLQKSVFADRLNVAGVSPSYLHWLPTLRLHWSRHHCQPNDLVLRPRWWPSLFQANLEGCQRSRCTSDSFDRRVHHSHCLWRYLPWIDQCSQCYLEFFSRFPESLLWQ